MSDKKKAPAPPPKAPAPPAKTESPPAGTAPASTAADKDAQSSGAPAGGGADYSQVPVAASPDAPTVGASVAPGVPKLTLPQLMPTPKLTPPALAGPYTLPPTPEIDWLSMRSPFTTRGVAFGDREASSIEAQWSLTYRNMMNLGLGPKVSLMIANKATPLAIDFSLSRDNPTAQERIQAQDELMLGKPITTITIPTLPLLETAIDKLTGKKVNLTTF